MLTAAEMRVLEAELGGQAGADQRTKKSGHKRTSTGSKGAQELHPDAIRADGAAVPRTDAPGASRFRDKDAFYAFRKQQEGASLLSCPVFL